ncbi:MAG: NYN domain-containing protein [Dehalococcoidia bacterium]
MTPQRPRSILYVDGFNLYYAIRGTPNKWLDLGALADRVLPHTEVVLVRYFTAEVKAFDDVRAPARQQAYLRAVGSLPRLAIHRGQFRVNEHSLPLSEDHARRAARQGGRAGTRVPVLKAEEKGSDVNLATYLLIDAYEERFEEAAVITNDSDLTEPIRHVSRQLGRPVWLMNNRGRPARELQRAASKYLRLTHDDFAACQLPDPVIIGSDKVSKPPKWSVEPY